MDINYFNVFVGEKSSSQCPDILFEFTTIIALCTRENCQNPEYVGYN